MKTVEVPEELLDLLRESYLGDRSEADQVRAALAIHLFQEGLISLGKAAELAGLPRVDLELMLAKMGLPVVQYDLADYKLDQSGVTAAEQRASS